MAQAFRIHLERENPNVCAQWSYMSFKLLRPWSMRGLYKGQTNIKKFCTRWNSDIFNLVDADICGPFSIASSNDHRYFITFTNNYSFYGYLQLIHEKSQLLDMFKIYKAEVKNQLNRKIKAIRFDHSGEYYGRYDGSGRCPGSFINFLKECGIVAQYTMSGISCQNGVAER